MGSADAAALVIERALALRLAEERASVVVLCAAHGYGKSTVASQIAQRFERTSWLAPGSLDVAGAAQLVVIDDAHLVAPARLAQTVGRLAEAGARVVVCARGDAVELPGVPPSAVRYVGCDELRFSRAEIASLLGASPGEPIVADVEGLTAGRPSLVALCARVLADALQPAAPTGSSGA